MLRTQPAADPCRFIEHRPQSQFHKFVGGHHSGDPRADDGNLLPVSGFRYLAQPVGMADPCVELKWEVGPKD
ncbi:Uncharacterised protein [Mycobacteroides abscessus subsp. abscessus]|nr:Uncharacterised protein [Mycobacteroides abscessus subsp. abscessus]